MKKEKTTKNLETKNWKKNHIRQYGRWYGFLSLNLSSILLSLCSFIVQSNSFWSLLSIITTSKPISYSYTNHNTSPKPLTEAVAMISSLLSYSQHTAKYCMSWLNLWLASHLGLPWLKIFMTWLEGTFMFLWMTSLDFAMPWLEVTWLSRFYDVF